MKKLALLVALTTAIVAVASGPAGAATPKPADWVVTCDFRNRKMTITTPGGIPALAVASNVPQRIWFQAVAYSFPYNADGGPTQYTHLSDAEHFYQDVMPGQVTRADRWRSANGGPTSRFSITWDYRMGMFEPLYGIWYHLWWYQGSTLIHAEHWQQRTHVSGTYSYSDSCWRGN